MVQLRKKNNLKVKNYFVDSIVKGIVENISSNYASVRIVQSNINLKSNKGFLSIDDISDYYIPSINKFFNVGESVYLIIKEYNKKYNSYACSYKEAHPMEIKFKTKIIPTISHHKNLFRNLHKNLLDK